MIPFPYKDENPSPSRKGGVWTLLVLNVLAIAFWRAELLGTLGFVPAKLQAHQWLTAQFLHAGLFHLFGNMWFLWIFGDNVEGRMRLGFLPFYIASGLVAFWLHLALSPGSDIPCIGASGAVSGVIGAYLVLFPNARLRCFLWVIIPIFFSMRALYFGLLYIGVQSLMIWLTEGQADVAYGAHLGGAIFGLVVGSALKSAAPEEAVEMAGEEQGELLAAGTKELRAKIGFLLSEKRDEAAIGAYSMAVRKDPYFELEEQDQLRMGDRLARLGRPHLAKNALEKHILRRPLKASAAHAWLLLGFVEETHFLDFDAAINAYEAALKHRGATPEVVSDAELRIARAREVLAKTFVAEPEEGERYWVVLESLAPLNPMQVRRAAALLKKPEDAFRAHLADAPGVIANSLAPAQAARIARELERLGVPVVVLPEKGILRLPPARLLGGIAVSPTGLSLSELGGARTEIPWSRCLLVSAMGLASGGEGGRSVSPVLELVTLEPLERRRWTPEPGGPPSAQSLALYFDLLQEIVNNARGVPVNRGAQFALRRILPEASIFPDIAHLDRNMAWNLQLASLKKEGAYREWSKAPEEAKA